MRYYCHIFQAINNVTTGTAKQRIEETFGNDCLCLLNIFYQDEWIISLINSVQNMNLKQFSDTDE